METIQYTRNLPCTVEGSVFMMGTEDARKICEENYSKFDVNITIRNLEEEAMDEDESSGVSDGTD